MLNSLGAHAVVAEEKVAFPLQLEVKIPLGDVRGRIDHMALDLKRQRLFVADLENDSIGVVDLASHHVVRTLSGLRKPQGVAYLAASDVVYVANAGDGSVRLFRGNDYAPIGRVDLGEDADNIRINAAGTRVMVGHNDGSLAVLDPSGRLVGNVPLRVHPEGFQIDDKSGHVLIDLPNDHSMVVVDDASLKQVARWSTGTWRRISRWLWIRSDGTSLLPFAVLQGSASFQLRMGPLLPLRRFAEMLTMFPSTKGGGEPT